MPMSRISGPDFQNARRAGNAAAFHFVTSTSVSPIPAPVSPGRRAVFSQCRIAY